MIDPQPQEPTPERPADTPATEAMPHPWANLDPEQFRLLRLAPLPADRNTGLRPLRFAQLGRVVRHSKAQSLLRLQVQLHGQRLRPEQNLLEVWIDHRNKEVRFGPEGGLQVEPGNRGLGRLLLAQGIAWAKQHCGHYQIQGGLLPAKTVGSEDAKARRDRCLLAQGFTLDYLDPLQLMAFYGAPRVATLHEDWNVDKVQIVDTLETAAMLQQADQTLHEQAVKIRKLEERIDRLRREDSTLRFTIGCLVAFSLFQAGLLVWIATR
ncbi:hypothetical protein LPB260_28485 [Pseudomonas sp. LPB0260]|uniref:hypothetical protein n=1 Tax=Pseudomonas sp. LPB0260 TaxID=2614442 RepID=UPI0015C254F4|nr:hypothetical protein [Pseudomonas sp. LPB0260]QLC74613.1 hypothetical protein LPB260_13535 [Pseudomonas sp. LPB0260]QLC77381.1 hypothetical protein LPB260_28485 [Pseudomonas sp. LPB0260]